MFDLTDHLCEYLTTLLPDALELVSAPEKVILTSRAGGSPKTVATHSYQVPESLGAERLGLFAHHLLADIQDLVVMHLHQPWPDPLDGRALHASAVLSGRSIRLGFRNPASPEEDVVRIPAFILPDPADDARTAG